MSVAISAFDAQKIEFNFFKARDGGQKKVYINKDSSRAPVRLQLCDGTPNAMLRAPFGISEPYGANDNAAANATDTGRRSMEVAIIDPVLKAKLRELDQRCKDYAVQESMTLFGKTLDRVLVEDRFCSPFREFSEEGKSDLLRLKLPEDCEILCMDTYNKDTKQMSCKRGNRGAIRSGSRLLPSVEISPIWFVARDSQFGYSLTVTNVIVNASDTGNQHVKGKEAFVLAEGVSMVISDDARPPTPTAPGGTAAVLDGIDFTDATDEPPTKKIKLGGEEPLNEDLNTYL